ncbi:MAG: hypothetical protein E7211_20450 [Clostridium lundense]|nr:hypothetical protein [Clostridium lundense]
MKKQSGNHSSKYALNPEQLEEDLQQKENDRNAFKDLVRHLVLLDPSKLDLRFRNLIDVAREIKQEFNL